MKLLTSQRFLRLSLFFIVSSLLISRTAHSKDRLLFDGTSQTIKRSVVLMTTNVEFTLVSDETQSANAAIDSAIKEFHRIESLMSEWKHDSLISAVNKNAYKKAVSVSEELFRLLSASKDISVLTKGKFDITFASAGKLWDFREAIIPTQLELKRATAKINYQFIELDSDSLSVRLTEKDTKIGLGGIAKGYAVDRAVQLIKKAGFSEFSINAGGDLFVVGQHSDGLWRVGIQDPRNVNTNIALIPLANAAVATSGDYERFFIKDGIRYSHIIDPTSGQPARLCQSVTIIAPSTYYADALATGVFVLGSKEGMALVETLHDVEAVIIDKDGVVSVSSGLPKLNRLD